MRTSRPKAGCKSVDAERAEEGLENVKGETRSTRRGARTRYRRSRPTAGSAPERCLPPIWLRPRRVGSAKVRKENRRNRSEHMSTSISRNKFPLFAEL